MKSNALAEPDIESNTTGFTVTLFHKSLYDPNVKLWLSNFESVKLTENQTAVMALGYGGKEFSTQDVIDRLGIVDTDQVRQILTPLRSRGLITRVLNDAQAIKICQQHRIPKRAVKVWCVNETATANVVASSETTTDAKQEDALHEQNVHRLFIAKLPYTAGQSDVIAFISQFCQVLGFNMPAGTLPGNPHRGYAFAVVSWPGSTEELVERLDGKQLHDRLVRVARQR